jgi:hypothetical protein
MPQHGRPSPARNQQICAEKDKRVSMARHQIRSVIDSAQRGATDGAPVR